MEHQEIKKCSQGYVAPFIHLHSPFFPKVYWLSWNKGLDWNLRLSASSKPNEIKVIVNWCNKSSQLPCEVLLEAVRACPSNHPVWLINGDHSSEHEWRIYLKRAIFHTVLSQNQNRIENAFIVIAFIHLFACIKRKVSEDDKLIFRSPYSNANLIWKGSPSRRI